MGINLGGGQRGTPNIDINLVPIVDVMTCLTAFLLLTSVWVQVARLDIAAGAKAGEQGQSDVVSVLIERDRVWLGDQGGTAAHWISRGDVGELRDVLRAIRSDPARTGVRVEVAAISSDGAPVVYQDMMDVMSLASASGFPRVSIIDADELTVPPRT